MSRLIVASLRRRAGRAVALLLGVLVATAGFTVLTGSTETSRLEVTGTVAEHARGSYDILVRPAGSQTDLERQRGLVQPNFLGGQYGGVSERQWRAITGLAGVEVAAPVAMLGYQPAVYVPVELDITGVVDWQAEHQLIELRPHWLADRGLTTAIEPHTVQYVYVTRRPVVWPVYPDAPLADEFLLDEVDIEVPYSDGVVRSGGACGGAWYDGPVPHEIQPDGEVVPICLHASVRVAAGERVSYEDARQDAPIVHLGDGGEVTVIQWSGVTVMTRRVVVATEVPRPLTLAAAVDPAQEAALVGLDTAIVAGRYLAEREPAVRMWDEAGAVNAAFPDELIAPALVSAHVAVDEQIQLHTRQVEWDGSLFAGESPRTVLGQLGSQPRGRQHTTPPVEVADSHIASDQDWAGGPLATRFQPGPAVMVEQPDGTLRVQLSGDGGIERVEGGDAWSLADPLMLSPLSEDTRFRHLTILVADDSVGDLRYTQPVGTFDPDLLTGLEGLGRVPLETYLPPHAVGADDAARELLGGQPLLPPASAPGAYLTTPPSVLMSLDTLLAHTTDPVPISAVRVRVADVVGFDELSRERVRVVAEQITTATGLDVDIVFGSSPAPQEVVLPAGELGRPELRLAEDWSLKAAAVAIVEAVDRKSVVLFGLILVVCVLFVGNATAAAVRDRQRELAVLACLGWARWRLAATIAGEVALVGLVAGALAAVVTPLLGSLAGVVLPAGQAWLAVPVAVGLALLAALVPAWRGSRAHPGAAVAAAVAQPGARARHRRGVAGMAVGNLVRVPGRTGLGVLALAVGIGGLTVLAGVMLAFHGTVTGSLLGDAVSVRVRGVDAVAVLATVLLGLVAVADVLYVSVRERAGELAALRATGWSDVALGRLVTFEGLGIGAVGGLLGAGVGLAGAAWFAGTVSLPLVGTAVGVAASGMVLAGVAALVPAVLQCRLPMALRLAEE